MLVTGGVLLALLTLHVCIPSFGMYLKAGLAASWKHIQQQAKRYDYTRVYNPVIGIETTYAAEVKNNDLINSIVHQAEDTSITACQKLGGVLIVTGEDGKPETWGTKCSTPATEGKMTGK
jgi:hypothetical protein